MKPTNLKQTNVAKPRKWFQRRRRWHDPMLVLNMSIFNFDGGWNRVFNPIPQRENVWGYAMNTTRSSILVAEVPDYAELQREMHDALRAQHPEWIEADGKSLSHLIHLLLRPLQRIP